MIFSDADHCSSSSNPSNSDRGNASSDKRFPWYTGRGDDGSTQLLGDERVPKYSTQPETYGTVDEATSALGLARALAAQSGVAEIILEVQRHLYRMMSELAATMENREKYRFIEAAHIEWLTEQTDRFGDRMTMPREFVIPGETPAGGALDLARAVVRRAERRVLRASADGFVTNPYIARYLNRLSSLCYVLARFEDTGGGREDVRLARSKS